MEFFTRVLSANARSRENNVNKLVESQSIIQAFKENLVLIITFSDLMSYYQFIENNWQILL